MHSSHAPCSADQAAARRTPAAPMVAAPEDGVRAPPHGERRKIAQSSNEASPPEGPRLRRHITGYPSLSLSPPSSLLHVGVKCSSVPVVCYICVLCVRAHGCVACVDYCTVQRQTFNKSYKKVISQWWSATLCTGTRLRGLGRLLYGTKTDF